MVFFLKKKIQTVLCFLEIVKNTIAMINQAD